jgi:superfamily I DNA and/or RNA helicase
MRNYVQQNRKIFNPSQLIVLDKAIDMPANDILLIQGPPGTGKTHTITGIISMLLSSGVKKIMVCAPSNAAIDEIVVRIGVKGFLGQPNEKDEQSILEEGFSPDGMIVRLGALEYDPSPEVKKHTLDERLQETMNGNKAAKLKDKITYARELLDDLKVESTKDGEGLGYLRLDNHKHVNYLLILVSQNPRTVKEFVKRRTKEEHMQFLKKGLAHNEQKLKELMSGEHQK